MFAFKWTHQLRKRGSLRHAIVNTIDVKVSDSKMSQITKRSPRRIPVIVTWSWVFVIESEQNEHALFESGTVFWHP